MKKNIIITVILLLSWSQSHAASPIPGSCTNGPFALTPNTAPILTTNATAQPIVAMVPPSSNVSLSPNTVVGHDPDTLVLPNGQIVEVNSLYIGRLGMQTIVMAHGPNVNNLTYYVNQDGNIDPAVLSENGEQIETPALAFNKNTNNIHMVAMVHGGPYGSQRVFRFWVAPYNGTSTTIPKFTKISELSASFNPSVIKFFEPTMSIVNNKFFLYYSHSRLASNGGSENIISWAESPDQSRTWIPKGIVYAPPPVGAGFPIVTFRANAGIDHPDVDQENRNIVFSCAVLIYQNGQYSALGPSHICLATNNDPAGNTQGWTLHPETLLDSDLTNLALGRVYGGPSLILDHMGNIEYLLAMSPIMLFQAPNPSSINWSLPFQINAFVPGSCNSPAGIAKIGVPNGTNPTPASLEADSALTPASKVLNLTVKNAPAGTGALILAVKRDIGTKIGPWFLYLNFNSSYISLPIRTTGLSAEKVSVPVPQGLKLQKGQPVAVQLFGTGIATNGLELTVQ